jgi:RNA polymerase sigma-70 factor (ECF subfamily)
LAVDHRFEALYLASYSRVVRQVYAVTGDLHDAEDLVQEAFVRAASRWTRVGDLEAPEAWVRRVAFNLALDVRRRARRRVAALARWRVPAETAGPSEDRVLVDAALRALPPRQRQVVVLHHLVGLGVDEIARDLAVPTGTVKSRLRRGRALMLARLGPLDEEEVRLERG